jgi:CelD/BcsL family acetyltransferase involved in cellulose biosynthesis
MRLYELNRYIDLLDLKTTWSALLERCPHSIFSTWEWVSIWWKHFGRGKKLILLIAEEDNRVVGIAPLMYSVSTMLGAKRGKIEFVGTPHSDYNNFIIAEQKEQFLKLLIEYLKRLPEKWDLVDLIDIPQDSECLPFLKTVSSSIKPTENCPYLPLPNSFDVFMETLSYKKRKYVRRGLRKLESSFKVDFVDCSEIQHYFEGMNCLFELHQKKWESIGQSGVFSDQAVRDFHLEIAETFSREKRLSLNVLALSGIPVAVEYGFKCNFRYYAYLPGVDPEYSKFSVGNMLFILIVKKLIQEHFTVYDFLRGSEEYKDYWSAISKWNYQVTLTKADYFENIQHWWFNQYWTFGNRLKYLLKTK